MRSDGKDDPIRTPPASLSAVAECAAWNGDVGYETSPPIDLRVRAAARGDRAHAASLLAELLPRVRNLVRYLVRGDDEVDDLAQEGLLAVLRGLHTYRGEGSLESWVDRVVARTVFAHLKRRQHDPARAGVHGVELAVSIGDGAPPDVYVSRRLMAALLDELPFDQRHALVLHHVLGMSVPEISDELSVPSETVRSRLRLGMARLRARVGEER